MCDLSKHFDPIRVVVGFELDRPKKHRGRVQVFLGRFIDFVFFSSLRLSGRLAIGRRRWRMRRRPGTWNTEIIRRRCAHFAAWTDGGRRRKYPARRLFLTARIKAERRRSLESFHTYTKYVSSSSSLFFVVFDDVAMELLLVIG